MVCCKVKGCGRTDIKARGWCGKHYAQWRNTGDPIARVRPTYGQKRRISKQGYVYLYEPAHPLAHRDGYVAEHRKVAWDAGLMGGDKTLHVHHDDENKLNNDLSNLFVKTNSDHAREHARARGFTVNQYGIWPNRR